MLFLFENTLTHYIYIVFYTLISWARPAHNLGNFYAMRRHATPTATPSPRSEQPHAPEQCAHGASRTASPARVCVRIYLQVSPYLHHTNGLQCGGCFFSLEVCLKSQFALTVRNIPCFLGVDLRIAVFVEFGF